MKRTRGRQFGTGQALHVAALALVLLASSAASFGQDLLSDSSRSARRVLLIDDRLEVEDVRLLAIDGDVLAYESKYGRRRERAVDEILGLIASSRTAVSPHSSGRGGMQQSGGMVVMTDGRRFTGDLSTSGGDDEGSLLWSHGILGDITLDLDSMRSMVQPAGASWLTFDDSVPVQDEVVLINGDRMSGFLASVGASEFVLETDAGVVHIEAGRVAGVRLSNEPVLAEGSRVWLTDGTVAPLESIEVSETGAVQLQLEGRPTQSYDWSPIQGVVFDAGRLLPLSALSPVAQEAGADRRFVPTMELRTPRGTRGPAPALDAWNIVLPGPMVIRYELPDGARRLRADIGLDVGTEPWGDCEFVVRVDGIEVERSLLHSDGQTVSLNVQVPGRVLELEVEPGQYGPINDRVVLERPLLLVEQAQR